MPSVPASVVLTTARTLLNDDLTSLWSDSALFPKLAQAHRELQAKLKAAAVPVMRTMVDIPVSSGAVTLNLPTDLIEPISLMEKATGDPVNLFVPMTESDPLPTNAPQGNLIWWQWTIETVAFVGATTGRIVRLIYWRKLTEPTQNTDPVGFMNAELYLAPRTAALASASVGEDARHDSLTATAMTALNDVIIANRGRVRPSQGDSKRP